ncbi:hypothetical protein JCM24511_07417 [Saitozyma sp. JCM 24511]|jgi:hypothetical protein|nr:hypothetical protein JCM24511_07417 [Saitozyma sp. JCM 24511]
MSKIVQEDTGRVDVEVEVDVDVDVEMWRWARRYMRMRLSKSRTQMGKEIRNIDEVKAPQS